MTQPIRRLAAAAALCAAPGLAAAVPGGYSSVVVFSDSLADTGNVFAAAGGLYPPAEDGYNAGRFTSGLTFVDLLAEANGLALQNIGTLVPPTGPTLYNFAFGGAKAAGDPTDTVVDFPEQRATFMAAQATGALALGPDPLALVSFGGNDAIAASFAGFDAFLGTYSVFGDLATAVTGGEMTASALGAGALSAARDSYSDSNAPLDRTRPRRHHETKLNGTGLG